jgi:hypothetical protein
VTVIATGFDSAVGNIQPRPIGYESAVAVNGGPAPVFSPQDSASEDLNVPTFIRRQAD